MKSIGRKLLISQLERVFHDQVMNNGRSIRYPITFKNNSKLKGKYTLRVTPENEDYFYSGEYRFGANSLLIYQAIDALLEELSDRDLLDDLEIEDLEEALQNEYEEKY